MKNNYEIKNMKNKVIYQVPSVIGFGNISFLMKIQKRHNAIIVKCLLESVKVALVVWQII
jgi:hypothetical protein